MKEKIVVRSGDAGFEPSKIPGVRFKALRATERNAGTYLVRMDPGTSYPPHLHPGGEEVWVVEGTLRVGGDNLAAGDYMYTPPGGAHDASTKEGCTFLVIVPAPVKFLD